MSESKLSDQLQENLEEAVLVAHTICIPFEEVSIEELVTLVKEAKKKKVEVSLWHETSNFHQGVLIQLQRFNNRVEHIPLSVRE